MASFTSDSSILLGMLSVDRGQQLARSFSSSFLNIGVSRAVFQPSKTTSCFTLPKKVSQGRNNCISYQSEKLWWYPVGPVDLVGFNLRSGFFFRGKGRGRERKDYKIKGGGGWSRVRLASVSRSWFWSFVDGVGFRDACRVLSGVLRGRSSPPPKKNPTTTTPNSPPPPPYCYQQPRGSHHPAWWDQYSSLGYLWYTAVFRSFLFLTKCLY